MGKSLRTLLARSPRFGRWQRRFGTPLLASQDPQNVLDKNTHGTPILELEKFRVTEGLRPLCPVYQEGRSQTTQVLWGGPIPGPGYYPWDRVPQFALRDSAPWGFTPQLSNLSSRLPVLTWICGTAPKGKVLHPWCQRQYRWACFRVRTRAPGQPASPQPRSRGVRSHKRPCNFWAVYRVGKSLRMSNSIALSGRKAPRRARSLPARLGRASRVWI